MEISGTDPDVDVEKKDANIFIVKSFNQDNTKYVVDMSLGLCECKAGVNCSVCKHQYVLWANKVAQGTYFLLIFSQQQRMEFAEIAIGARVALLTTGVFMTGYLKHRQKTCSMTFHLA